MHDMKLNTISQQQQTHQSHDTSTFYSALNLEQNAYTTLTSVAHLEQQQQHDSQQQIIENGEQRTTRPTEDGIRTQTIIKNTSMCIEETAPTTTKTTGATSGNGTQKQHQQEQQFSIDINRNTLRSHNNNNNNNNIGMEETCVVTAPSLLLLQSVKQQQQQHNELLQLNEQQQQQSEHENNNLNEYSQLLPSFGQYSTGKWIKKNNNKNIYNKQDQ